MEELELCNLVKTDKSDTALLKLEELHSPLCYKVMGKYTPAFHALGINIEDILEEKQKLILEAALSFKPDKNCKFSTWLGNRVRYKCLKEINKKRKSPKIVHLVNEDLQPLLETLGFSPHSEDFSNYISTILEGLKDKRIKKIFKYRYEDELTFNQIGRKMKLTAQGVSNLHNVGIKILRAKIKNNETVDKT